VLCLARINQDGCFDDCHDNKTLCVFLHMIQCRNSQDRFTAERVARTRPKTYRAVVRLLAEPDARIEHIAQRHHVSTHTVRAIPARQAVSIAERKNRLVSIFGDVAEIAAERMEELAGKASLRDAGTTAGVATDKLLLLLGETGGGVPVQINLHTGVAELLHKRYNEMVEAVERGEALPNGETFSASPVELAPFHTRARGECRKEGLCRKRLGPAVSYDTEFCCT
jgi:hypothetical protein